MPVDSTDRQSELDSAPAAIAAGVAAGKSNSTDDAGRLTLWEWFSFSTVHLSVAVLYKLIGLSGLYQFGRAFGTAEYLVNYKRRRRFRRALGFILLPPVSRSEVRRYTRAHFMQTRCDKLFYIVLDCVPKETLASLLSIDQEDLLNDAVARGKGAHFAYSHHGAHHCVAALMALRGYKTAAVRDRNEGAIRRFMQARLDQMDGMQRTRMIFSDAFPREIIRCLEEGYFLGSAMDAGRRRHPNQKTETVKMFGKEVELLTGPLRVAVRCNVPVFQAFFIAEPGYRYRLKIVEKLIDEDSQAADVPDAVRRYARNVEDFVRRHPETISRF